MKIVLNRVIAARCPTRSNPWSPGSWRNTSANTWKASTSRITTTTAYSKVWWQRGLWTTAGYDNLLRAAVNLTPSFLWSPGGLTLKDLTLKPEALAAFDLPIEVKAGHIGKSLWLAMSAKLSPSATGTCILMSILPTLPDNLDVSSYLPQAILRQVLHDIGLRAPFSSYYFVPSGIGFWYVVLLHNFGNNQILLYPHRIL